MPPIEHSSASSADPLLHEFERVAKSSRRAGVIDLDPKSGFLRTRFGHRFSIRAVLRDFFYRITGRETPSEFRQRSVIEQFRSSLQRGYQDIGTRVFDKRFADPSLWKKTALTPDHVSQIFIDIRENIQGNNRDFLQAVYFDSPNDRLRPSMRKLLYSLMVPASITDPTLIKREKTWIRDLSRERDFQRRLRKHFDQSYRARYPNGKLLTPKDVEAITADTIDRLPELSNIRQVYRYYPNLANGKFVDLHPRILKLTSEKELHRFSSVIGVSETRFFESVEKEVERVSGGFRTKVSDDTLREIIVQTALAYIKGKPLPKIGAERRPLLSPERIARNNDVFLLRYHPQSHSYHFADLLQKSSAWPPANTRLSLGEILHRKEEIFEIMNHRYGDRIFQDMAAESRRFSDNRNIITQADAIEIIGKASHRYLDDIISDMKELYPDLRNVRPES